MGAGPCQLPIYAAWSPAGDTLGRAAKLTWVNRALFPSRAGDKLVFIHHLDVLILRLIAGGGETEVRPGRLSSLGPTGETAGRAYLMVVCRSWRQMSASSVKRMVW